MVESIPLKEVKNFLNENYFANLIAYLRKETSTACNKQKYMQCNNLIQHQCDSMDQNKHMFGVFNDLLKEYVEAEVAPKLVGKSGLDLLQNLVAVWDSFVIYAISADRMFAYLNRNWIKNQQMAAVAEQCMRYFQKNVYDKIKVAMCNALIEQIDEDRARRAVDKAVVKKSIKVFADLGLEVPVAKRDPKTGTFDWVGKTNLRVYNSDFETQYLADTRETSERYALIWNAQLNCPEYCLNVQRYLTNEEANAELWLHTQPPDADKREVRQSTTELMKAIVIEEMVSKRAQEVSEKETGCTHMFEQRNINELKLLFEVFKRDETTFKFIIEKMVPYIQNRGKATVEQEELLKDPSLFSQKLLELKAEIDHMVSFSFQNQMEFQKARDQSFTFFMNN